MLSKEISKCVLSIGNRCDMPDGGISQVLYNYRRDVFPTFKHITNFKLGNKFYKLYIAVLAVLKEFIYLIFDRSIKIVHVHTPADIAFVRSSVYIHIAKAFRKKVIVHLHSGRFDNYYLQHKDFVDKVFSRCDVIVALTHKIKDFYDEVGCKNVVVINNIIERPLLSSERYNDGLIHLLFLGGITEEKGVFDMLDVINENKSAFDGRLMFHIGGNKEVDRLKSIIASNKLQNVVKFEGWLSGNEKVKMLNMCDIFILPSHTEGLPISILEALSYGKYIISTNVGGIPEIVTKDNGILFAPKDKKALSRILNGIATSGLEGMSPDVIRTTAANYMPENVAMQLDKLYKQIL